MFDIGFWELATIAIIGIVVVGPERLPEVVRTVAAYVRKARRAFQDVKSDIERELDLDDLRRQMHDVDMEDHIKKLNQSVMDADRDVRKAASRFDDDLRRGLDIDNAGNSTESHLKEDLNDPEVRAAEEDDMQHGEFDALRHETQLPDEGSDAERYADTGVEQSSPDTDGTQPANSKRDHD